MAEDAQPAIDLARNQIECQMAHVLVGHGLEQLARHPSQIRRRPAHAAHTIPRLPTGRHGYRAGRPHHSCPTRTVSIPCPSRIRRPVIATRRRCRARASAAAQDSRAGHPGRTRRIATPS